MDADRCRLQGSSILESVYRLVFCTMVGEHTFDIRHKADSEQVQQEQRQAHQPFQQVAEQI